MKNSSQDGKAEDEQSFKFRCLLCSDFTTKVP